MKVNVRGKNKFQPTEAIKVYASNKLQKLNQYFKKNDDLEATVVCKVYDSYEVVEVTIPTKNIILRAEVKANSLTAAIDLAIDKLETQIRKHKSKIEKSISRRNGLKEKYNNVEFDMDNINPIENLNKLVKEKQVKLEPMDTEEAILEMEMSGHDFYIFLNKHTHKTNLVYIRNDGNYGVIDTE